MLHEWKKPKPAGHTAHLPASLPRCFISVLYYNWLPGRTESPHPFRMKKVAKNASPTKQLSADRKSPLFSAMEWLGLEGSLNSMKKSASPIHNKAQRHWWLPHRWVGKKLLDSRRWSDSWEQMPHPQMDLILATTPITLVSTIYSLETLGQRKPEGPP